MAICPETPQSEREEDLGFVRQPMVDWFAPGQLLDTGIKAVLASIFGAYADKREMQAALSEISSPADYSEKDECWIDYTADIGDGWNSTYSVAKLLAEEELIFAHNEGTYHTQRGNILVMGGDQVYPTATRDEYQNRLVGPYRSALPCVLDEQAVPHLYVIPGNHDWYDGLTAFTRLFLQKRWIGGWKTQQERSYFAMKLPHNWWLLGIDIQLIADIDLPQLDYFREVSEQFRAGDKIILCTAQPEWVHAPENPNAFRNLAFFEREMIRKKNAELKLTLTGDLHHYCHYVSSNGDKHKITAGGGGAYLYPTHELPAAISLAPGNQNEDYSRTEVYPDLAISKKLAFGALKLPWQNWKLAALLATLYLFFAWVIHGASAGITGTNIVQTITNGGLTATGFGNTVVHFFETLLYSPLGMAIFLLLVVGMMVLAYDKRARYSKVIGLMHGAAHVLLTVFLTWFCYAFNSVILGLTYGSLWHALIYIAEMLVAGALLGGFLMGLYLAIASRFLGLNANEAFSCQCIEDYKNFMRLHIDHNGDLTIYPIGVNRICKKWQLNTEASDGQSWFDMAEGEKIDSHLIEKPIKIR